MHAHADVGRELMSQESYLEIVPGEPGDHPDATIGELVDRLESTTVQLGRLIECRSHEALQRPGHDGDWGVLEILCHLRDWEAVVHARVDHMLEGDRPVLEEPDTSMWPLEHDYGAQDSHAVVDELAGMRHTLVERLRGLEPGMWTAPAGLDGEEVTLRDVVERTVDHDARFLREAREAVG